MKKLAILLAFAIAPFLLFGQDSTAVDSTAVAPQVENFTNFIDQLRSQVGDTLVIDGADGPITIVLTETHDILDTVGDIVKQYKENKPEGVLGWVTFIVSILLAGPGLSRLLAIKNVWTTLTGFFAKKNSPTNIIAISSLVVSVIFTLVSGTFDAITVTGLTGFIYMTAHLFYKNYYQAILKKKKEAKV